jgi:glycine/D-amino acid oxidase-like deaminating enzyme
MKVGIVGCGFVGGSVAYAVALTGAASEVVLIDINAAPGRAQAEDILHATLLAAPVRTHPGGCPGLGGAGGIPTILHPTPSPEEQARLRRGGALLLAAARHLGY